MVLHPQKSLYHPQTMILTTIVLHPQSICRTGSLLLDGIAPSKVFVQLDHCFWMVLHPLKCSYNWIIASGWYCALKSVCSTGALLLDGIAPSSNDDKHLAVVLTLKVIVQLDHCFWMVLHPQQCLYHPQTMILTTIVLHPQSICTPILLLLDDIAPSKVFVQLDHCFWMVLHPQKCLQHPQTLINI